MLQAACNVQGYRTKPPDDLLAECVQTAAVAFRIIEHLAPLPEADDARIA